MQNRNALIFLILLLFMFNGGAFAGQYESIENLASIVKNFTIKNTVVGENESLQVSVPKPNISIQLAMCGKKIRSDLPEGVNRDKIYAVQLTCDAPIAWQVVVPVTVSILTKVIVAKQNIATHQVITDDDVDVALYDKSRLYNGFFSGKDAVVGQMSNQSIVAGMVLTKRNVQQPTIVHRNEVIDLTAKNNTIMVTMKGVSRSDGGLHDMVKAYNPSSKKLMDAIVTGPGRVEVVS